MAEYGHTLRLADDWDLHVNAAGGLDHPAGDYAVAQNVANAFRLFTRDAYYDPDRGIPHFALELNAAPKTQILKARLKKAALAVAGVKDCTVNLLGVEGRDLSGYAALTLTSGGEADVSL